jgi:hypothetical protein
MNESLLNKHNKNKHITRGFAMKAIVAIFAAGFVYYALVMNYLVTCMAV